MNRRILLLALCCTLLLIVREKNVKNKSFNEGFDFGRAQGARREFEKCHNKKILNLFQGEK